MSTGLSTLDPTVVAAFHHSLTNDCVVVAGLLLLALVAGWLRREVLGITASVPGPEPTGRRLLRLGFGGLWLLDGLLQLQAAMPLGLPTQVVQPAVSGSPAWLHRLVSDAVSVWTRHPISAATSAVWIQVGIGLLLLFAPRGAWSRLAGLTSLGWGLAVWVFGEAFGSILGPGASWLFGAPGAAFFYVLAGGLLALPERSWRDRRLGRRVLAGLGVLLVAMAVLQAWPGRGFWQGQPGPAASAGRLTAMVRGMATTPQPHPLVALLRSFAGFTAAHGWAVNAVVVSALALLGAVCLSGRPRLLRWAVPLGVLFCLATWLLVQDLGVFGGLGTDPNSMVPFVLLLVSGYLALRGASAATGGADPPASLSTAPDSRPRLPALVTATVAVATFGVVLVGAVPMTLAAVNSNQDTLLTEAINGAPATLDTPAAGFHLIDQAGRPVSLASLRGRTIALTFLDPVCTNDCPLLARAFLSADDSLAKGIQRGSVFVAIDDNPVFRSVAYLQAFDHQEGLQQLPNWLFLTGSVNTLARIWNSYGLQVFAEPDGSMVAHGDQAYVIDRTGRLRVELLADPGSNGSDTASLASQVAGEVRAVTASG